MAISKIFLAFQYHFHVHFLKKLYILLDIIFERAAYICYLQFLR